jgi:hypothetical protein
MGAEKGIERGWLTLAVMRRENIDANAMTPDQKVQLEDEIFLQQPNLLVSILVLPRMGVDMVQLEAPLHVLLVAFQAMKRSGARLAHHQRGRYGDLPAAVDGQLHFNEGLPRALLDQHVRQFCAEHQERYLLAFVYGHLGEHDLLSVRTEAEKYLLLAALNLVECTAFGDQVPRK